MSPQWDNCPVIGEGPSKAGARKLSEQEKKELVKKMGEIIYRRTKELKEEDQEVSSD